MQKTLDSTLARVILDASTSHDLNAHIQAPKEDGSEEPSQSLSSIFIKLNDDISDYSDLKNRVSS